MCIRNVPFEKPFSLTHGTLYASLLFNLRKNNFQISLFINFIF